MIRLLSIVMLVVLVSLALFFILGRQSPRRNPPSITLPDGSLARILAVTYGTNHVVGPPLARLAARLPNQVQGLLSALLSQRVAAQRTTTSEPQLVVWLDRGTNSRSATMPNRGYLNAFLADGSNFISGAETYVGTGPFYAKLQPLYFRVLPRRDPIITLNFFHHPTTGGVHQCGSLPFANPVYRSAPGWKPEPLPVTKRAGDVQVALTGLHTGHDSNSGVRARRGGGMEYTHGTNRLNGENYTVVDLNLRLLTNTNEVWQVTGVEISDATGNVAHNASMSWSGDRAGFAFTPSLWPGEPAWKLKLEIKRNQGFRPEELFVFKDVPLGELDATNALAWTTNHAGVTVTLQHIIRRAPLTNNSWSSSDLSAVKFTHSKLPAGTHLDLVTVVFSPGKTNRSESWESSNEERTYHFREIPRAAKTADFTVAVQQSRTVEFTVKPELPAPPEAPATEAKPKAKSSGS